MPAEVASTEYARECREVNERFDRISMMLASGGELEAIQVAETPPSLLDRAVALSFGGEAEWQEYCSKHGLEAAPVIDVTAMGKLENLYSRGLSPNHPLYKQYRTAVLSRDEEKAYEAIKLIARLNPNDANSRKELDRHEHKMVVRTLKNLRDALDREDKRQMLEHLASLEATGRHDDLKEETEYQEAVRQRNEILKNEAQKRLPGLLDDAESGVRDGGDWKAAARISAEIEDMLERHRIPMDAGQTERFEKIQERIAAERRDAKRQARAAELAGELDQIADEVETRSVTPDGIGPEFASDSLERIFKIQRELESLRCGVPEATDARTESARAQLDQILARRRSRRKARMISASAVAILVLLAASVFGWFAVQASDRTKLLAKLRKEGQSSALQKLVGDTRKSDALLLKFPKVSSEMAVAEQWLDEFGGAAAAVKRQLDRLENEVDQGFADTDPTDVWRRMKQAGEMVEKLPPDLCKEAEARLAIIRNEAERYLSACQTKTAGQAREAFAKVEENLGNVHSDGPAATAQKTARQCLDALKPFVAMAGRPDPILRLPASMEAQANDLNGRSEKMLKNSTTTLDALASVQNASSLAEYSASIRVLGNGEFKEAALARRLLEDLPDDDRLRAFLIFRGDLKAFAAAKQDRLKDLIVPASTTAKDRGIVRDLTSNECLVNLWKVVWKDAKGAEHKALSRGALKVTSLPKGGRSWSGEIAAYPKRISMPPSFSKQMISTDLGNIPISNKTTETSKLLESLLAGGLLDATGTEFKKSVVPLVDRVLRNGQAPVMAKAYVICQLFSMLREREYEWGLQYIPQLLDDMKEARRIEIEMPPRPCDWLCLEKTKWTEKWSAYFASRTKRHYYQDLEMMHSLVKNGLSAPVMLAAVVDTQRTATAKQGPETRMLWGMVDGGDNSVTLKIFGQSGRKGGKIPLPPAVLPLSPVFAMSFGNAQQLEFLLQIHGIGKTREADQAE